MREACVNVREARHEFFRFRKPVECLIQIAPLFTDDPGWRPAIEVRGEGLFLVLDESRIAEWEHQDNVGRRIRALLAVSSNRSSG